MNTQVHQDLLQGETIYLGEQVQLHVAYQKGRQPTVVLLHSGLGDRRNWRAQYDSFCADGQSVLVYDLAGHGQSSPSPSYSIARHCQDLWRLLDYFQITDPVLCCHSYGLPLGLEWASEYPVRGLVLIAGGTHNLAPWWEIPLMKALRWGGRYLFQLDAVQTLSQRMISPHAGKNMALFFAENPLPTQIHPYQALEIFWRYNYFDHHLVETITSIPTLVISGGCDPTFTYQMGEELAKIFIHGKHLHFPDAGHVVMAEHPTRVNQAIADFLGTL